MSEHETPRLLGAHLPLHGGGIRTGRLPADLQEQAVRRLGLMALLVAGLMLASVGFNTLFHLVVDGMAPLDEQVAQVLAAWKDRAPRWETTTEGSL